LAATARELLADGLQARQPGQGAYAVLLILPGGVAYRCHFRPAFLAGLQAGLLCSLAMALRNSHGRLSRFRFGKVARGCRIGAATR